MERSENRGDCREVKDTERESLRQQKKIERSK